MPHPGPPAPPAPAPASGRAAAAMVLGIVALVTGFLAVPLLCAVAANVPASLALQEIAASGGRMRGRAKATAGIARATSVLGVWITSFAVVAAVGEA